MWADECIAIEREQRAKAAVRHTGFVFRLRPRAFTFPLIMKFANQTETGRRPDWSQCRLKNNYSGQHKFVPICACEHSEVRKSAQKWRTGFKRDLAPTSEVANYQQLTLRLRIPSLAPFSTSQFFSFQHACGQHFARRATDRPPGPLSPKQASACDLHVCWGLHGRKSSFLEGSMKDHPVFPERVEYKSCATTIYQQNNRKTIRYEVKYYDFD